MKLQETRTRRLLQDLQSGLDGKVQDDNISPTEAFSSEKSLNTFVRLKGDKMKGNLEVPTLQAGNVADGNYAEFEADGTLKFNGDSNVWDDSMVALTAFRSGGTALSFDTLTTNIWTHRFDVNDEIHLVIQFPHSIKVNSVISPHIHIVNKQAIGNTGYNVAFDFTWTWANISTAFPAEQSQLNVKQSFQNNAALQHKMLVFDDITPITGQGGISSILLCRIKRVAASTQNYSGADIFTLGFDVHYQKDTVGSRERASK